MTFRERSFQFEQKITAHQPEAAAGPPDTISHHIRERAYRKGERVGLSNILDGELVRRGPVKRSHREVVGAAVMGSELLGEVIEGVETVTGVKALLVLPVASFHLAVVARCVGTDELVADL